MVFMTRVWSTPNKKKRRRGRRRRREKGEKEEGEKGEEEEKHLYCSKSYVRKNQIE